MGTSLYVSSNNCEPNTKKFCMQSSFILEVKKADINIHFNIQIKERSNKNIHPFSDASFAFLSKGEPKRLLKNAEIKNSDSDT